MRIFSLKSSTFLGPNPTKDEIFHFFHFVSFLLSYKLLIDKYSGDFSKTLSVKEKKYSNAFLLKIRGSDLKFMKLFHIILILILTFGFCSLEYVYFELQSRKLSSFVYSMIVIVFNMIVFFFIPWVVIYFINRKKRKY